METSLPCKRVLVTGGFGFIGSHLVSRLVELGANVTVLQKSGEPRWRLAAYSGRFDTVVADLTDRAAIMDICRQVRPEGVFHLAAYGVDSATQDMLTAINVNVLGTLNILMGMRACGCTRIITMGSGAEYGNHKALISEDAALRPESAYAASKAAAVLIAHQYAAESGISIITFRPFGVFGEAEPRHKIIAHTILTMLSGDDLRLTPCTQLRDYCYVEDIVDALILGFEREDIQNAVFNVGTGHAQPLKNYIELLRTKIQPRGQVLYGALPHRTNEVWSPAPDVSYIHERLNWQCAHTLGQGVDKTISWFRENSRFYN